MNRPIRILELRSVWGTGGGPEKTILLGTARTDPRRFDLTVCYLRDRRDPIFSVDRKAASLPVNYLEVVESHSFDPTIFPRLRRLVREREIDIVHAHDYKTNILAWLLSRFEAVTPLSTVHGWTGHSLRERWLYYPLDKRVLRAFPRVIAVSSDARRELLDRGARPDEVSVVLNGIDHTLFRRDRSREAPVRRDLGFTGEDFVIGAVGRVEPQKRFDLLMDAFASLRMRWPRLKLMIVGAGSRLEALHDQVTRLGIGDSCQLLGNRTDIADLHHACNLFVQSSDYEGTPNAVLEAMALETPVVATSAGGTAEIVRHGVDGLVVPIGDSQAIAAAIESVLQNPEAARARVEAARHRVETDLSFEARMAAVEAIYVELFQRRSGTNPTHLAAART
jgi:glycosyltransferase involved in cell wall biosynthesis